MIRYNCDFCGKLAKFKRTPTSNNFTHNNLGTIHRFCSKKCKTEWVYQKQREQPKKRKLFARAK